MFWHQHFGNPTTDIRKGKVIIHNFVYYTHRNSSCLKMSPIETLLSAKVNVLTESTISGVLPIKGLPVFSWSWILNTI